MGHNLGHHNLRNTPWLHRRVGVGYNGWGGGALWFAL